MYRGAVNGWKVRTVLGAQTDEGPEENILFSSFFKYIFKYMCAKATRNGHFFYSFGPYILVFNKNSHNYVVFTATHSFLPPRPRACMC